MIETEVIMFNAKNFHTCPFSGQVKIEFEQVVLYT